MILPYIPFLCLGTAVILLLILCVIDLRVRLLPNVYVFPFGAIGLLFHFSTGFEILGYKDILIGCALAYGFLYLLRAGANAYYKQDAFGLGDVKLMAMSGLWLGVEGVLIALTVGAFAGLLHGLGYACWLALKTRTKPNLHRLAIPAGPGFVVGIVLSALWIFYQSDFIVLNL